MKKQLADALSGIRAAANRATRAIEDFVIVLSVSHPTLYDLRVACHCDLPLATAAGATSATGVCKVPRPRTRGPEAASLALARTAMGTGARLPFANMTSLPPLSLRPGQG